MILKKYGKGYILKPPKNNKYYGDKYFHNGWWITKQNGWFFKKEQYNILIQYGALEYDSDSVNLSEDKLVELAKVATNFNVPVNNNNVQDEDEDEDEEQMVDDSDYEYENSDMQLSEDNEDNGIDLSSMCVSQYGKGYLLVPSPDSEFINDKYFYDGWWVEKRKGWFFKNDSYNWLLEHGAIEVSEVRVENIIETEDLSTMCFEKYGKGYMLYCPKTDKRFMSDYFMEGFWNKTTQGWFFKSQYYDKLCRLGAKYIKSEPDVDVVTNARITRSQRNHNNVKMNYVYDDY